MENSSSDTEKIPLIEGPSQERNFTDTRIEELKSRTWIFSGVAVTAILSVGAIFWKQLWWETLVGFILGLGSFYILVTVIQGVGDSTSKAFGKAVFLSFFKMGILICLIWILVQIGGDLIKALAGLLLSQVVIVGSSMITLARIPEKAVMKNA